MWGVCDADMTDSTGLPALKGEYKGRLEYQCQHLAQNLHKYKARKTETIIKEQPGRGRCVPCMFIFNLILQWRSLNVTFILQDSQWDYFVTTLFFSTFMVLLWN